MNVKPPKYPHLFPLVSKLEAAKSNIVAMWLKEEKIVTIFTEHKISILKFSQNYAPQIVSYFIDVIQEKQSLGDCPIMSKFVHYMLEKRIVPHEVYDICTRFRKIVTFHILASKDTQFEEYLKIVDEIATIFDANLSGVLKIFAEYLSQQHDIIEKSLAHQKKFEVMSRVIDVVGAKILIVQSGRVVLCNQPLFTTLGVDNISDLYKKYRTGLSFLNSVDFEEKLFAEEKLEEWIEKAAQVHQVVKVSLFDTQLRQDLSLVMVANKIPHSEPTKYLLTFRENSAQLDCDLENYISKYDRLTSLYSYAYFKSFYENVKQRISEYEDSLVIVEVGILKDINQIKGFEQGDRLLLETSETIRRLMDESMVAARLQGSRFGVYISSLSLQHAYDWAVQLRNALNKNNKDIHIVLTKIQKDDSLLNSEIRANTLVERLIKTRKNQVFTDIDGIDKYDLLENQEKFLSRLKKDLIFDEGVLLFKELVLKGKTKILAVHNDGVTISLSPKQILVANENEKFYFHCTTLGYVQARIDAVDKERATAKIDSFIFDSHTPLKRKMVRVVPDETFEVELIDDAVVVEAKVLNLNESYIAFFVKRKKSLSEGKVIFLDMHLNGAYLEAQGSVFKIEKEENGYRCVVYFHHTHNTKKEIDTYIAQRQVQIIQELNSL